MSPLHDLQFGRRAQFGEYMDEYDLNEARTKSARVRLIGNSVVPLVAEALVRATIDESRNRRAKGGATC